VTKGDYADMWYGNNYRWAIYEAIKRGDLTARDDWQAVKVSPSGFRYLEPLKDAQAVTERMQNRTSNLEAELAEQGKDLEEHLRQSARVILTAERVAAETGVDAQRLLQASEPAATRPAAMPPENKPT